MSDDPWAELRQREPCGICLPTNLIHFGDDHEGHELKRCTWCFKIWRILT